MSAIGPLPPLLGALAMIGLAAATAFGLRRPPPPEPEPEPTGPAEAMRIALAGFAHWLPQQPEAVRKAVAKPAETLLSRGMDMVAAIPVATDPDRLFIIPEIAAAHVAITRDLPETTAILDVLPAARRGEGRGLAHFAGAIGAIADATATAWDCLQSATFTELEIQQTYLSGKFPPDKGP